MSCHRLDHGPYRTIFLAISIFMNIVIIIWPRIGKSPNVFERLINCQHVSLLFLVVGRPSQLSLALVASNLFMPRLFDQTPPSYLRWARLFLSKSDNGSQLSPFPYIASVTNRIVLCTKVMFPLPSHTVS